MNFLAWISAFRIHTLPLAISGVLVGTFCAMKTYEIDFLTFLLTLITAIFLQILSNLANDFGDAASGVDSSNRKGPKRMVHAKKITINAMKKSLFIAILITFFTGITLIFHVFQGEWKPIVIFILLGLFAIIAAIKYTIGKKPYGYIGLGDIFVFIFFGLISVLGTYYLQTKTLNFSILLPASTIGLFSVGVLNINNIRDIDSDKKAGKRSIPVQIGKNNAVVYHQILMIVAIITNFVYNWMYFSKTVEWICILPLLLIFNNIQAVKTKKEEKLNPYLKQIVLITFFYSLLFSIGQIIVYY